VSVALQKVEGVTAVNVTLKEGRATLTLKPGNTVTLSELRRVIERNGFTPQGAAVVAEAEEIRSDARQFQVRVTGANEVFTISPTTKDAVRSDLQRYGGRKVVIEGVVPPQKTASGTMELKSVKQAGS